MQRTGGDIKLFNNVTTGGTKTIDVPFGHTITFTHAMSALNTGYAVMSNVDLNGVVIAHQGGTDAVGAVSGAQSASYSFRHSHCTPVVSVTLTISSGTDKHTLSYYITKD
jgi:hypothetical protein